MDVRDIYKHLGIVGNDNKFNIIKLKPLLKAGIKEAIKKTSYLNEEEKIEFLEMQKIIIDELILDMES